MNFLSASITRCFSSGFMLLLNSRGKKLEVYVKMSCRNFSKSMARIFIVVVLRCVKVKRYLCFSSLQLRTLSVKSVSCLSRTSQIHGLSIQ
jgi:hypothetical protein